MNNPITDEIEVIRTEDDLDCAQVQGYAVLWFVIELLIWAAIVAAAYWLLVRGAG